MTIGEQVEKLEGELMDHYLYSNELHNQFISMVHSATKHVEMPDIEDYYMKDLVNELEEKEAVNLYNSLQNLVKGEI